jgi:purine-binding chemotaxis protein CheW
MTRKRKVRYGELTPVRPITAVPAVRVVGDAKAPAASPRPTPARSSAPVEPPRTLRERARGRRGMVELLVFRVAHERFAVELASVDEAVDLAGIHHVPEMPPAMLGVVTVRDVLTPVYSPQDALGVALASGGCALVFRRGRSRLAIRVDDVEDIMSLDLGDLRDAPPTGSGAGMLLGVVRDADALLALVDADALLAACQAVPTSETA